MSSNKDDDNISIHENFADDRYINRSSYYRINDYRNDKHDERRDRHDESRDKHDDHRNRHDNSRDRHDYHRDRHDNSRDRHDYLRYRHDDRNDRHDYSNYRHNDHRYRHDDRSDRHDGRSDRHDDPSDRHDDPSDRHDNRSDRHDGRSDRHDDRSNRHDDRSVRHDNRRYRNDNSSDRHDGRVYRHDSKNEDKRNKHNGKRNKHDGKRDKNYGKRYNKHDDKSDKHDDKHDDKHVYHDDKRDKHDDKRDKHDDKHDDKRDKHDDKHDDKRNKHDDKRDKHDDKRDKHDDKHVDKRDKHDDKHVDKHDDKHYKREKRGEYYRLYGKKYKNHTSREKYHQKTWKKKNPSRKNCDKKWCDKNTVNISRTVLVDVTFGNDSTGKLETMEYPFKTIKAAILEIENPSKLEQWQILVNPGAYNEDNIKLSNNMSLRGNGGQPSETEVSVVNTTGNIAINNVRIFNIGGEPSINVNVLTDEIADIRNVEIDREGLDSEEKGLAIYLGGNGGIVNMTDVNIEAEFLLHSELNTLIKIENIELNSENVTGTIYSRLNSGVSYYQVVSGRLNEVNCQSNITVFPSFPNKPMVFYDNQGGVIFSRTSNSYILAAITSSDKVVDDKDNSDEVDNNEEVVINDYVYYVRHTGFCGSTLTDNNFINDSIPAGRSILLENTEGSEARLLNVKTPFTMVPRITGPKEGVYYVANSEMGNIISSGGLYTNIVTVNKEKVGSNIYYVQDNDHTILVSDEPVTVVLPNPLLVNQDVLYTGKTVKVKNITKYEPVFVEGALSNKTIKFLSPGETVTLQNDGKVWHIV